MREERARDGTAPADLLSCLRVSASPTVLRAHGPLALEAALVDALRAESARIAADPRRLSAPIVLAVPSEALRVHVAALCARELGAVVGVRVQTLAGLAHDLSAEFAVLGAAASGARAADILTLRAARESLRDEGEAFAAAAAASIADLLDAGLVPEVEPALNEALLESPESESVPLPERRMAARLVHAALAARAECAAHGVARHADVFTHAAIALRGSTRSPRARSVWLYGFTDVTGLQGDLVDALAAKLDVHAFWDESASAPRFGAALRTRLGIAAPGETRIAGESAPDLFRARGSAPDVVRARGSAPDAVRARGAAPDAVRARGSAPQHFRARGAEAEAREVLRRVRRLVDSGVVPERIGIVARDLATYRAALTVHAARLAIPVSAEGVVGPLDAAGRRELARFEILRDARRVPTDRWLAAHADSLQGDDSHLALLTGLRVLGATRLGAVADLDIDAALGAATELRLPTAIAREMEIASNTESAEDSDDDAVNLDGEDEAPMAAEFVVARTLPRPALEHARDVARRLVETIEAWPAHASGVEHARHTQRVLEVLGSGAEDGILLVARALANELPPTLAVSRAEFLDAAAPDVDAGARTDVGGRGGGVQIASVALARARAFEHVFVLGLNAGVFPASARADPLFGDDARELARACLPDLPLKRVRPEEESATFAQLMVCAPRVTLSWLVADADDEPRAPSPLLDWAGIEKPDDVDIVGSPVDAADGVPQPAHEHALLAARQGAVALAALLESAVAAGRAANGLATTAAPAIATARIAVLAEYDRAPGPVEPLGPFFGSVGPAAAGVRTARELPVTTLEGASKCPWQTFLTRVLRVRPPLDPLVGAPHLDARVTGTTAHALIADTTPHANVALEIVEEAEGSAPAWKSAERTRARALELAARALRAEGLYAPGLDALVAARAIEIADVARRLDEGDPKLRVLGAELSGWIPLDRERRLTFRADRAERGANSLRLVDWKSGSVFGTESKKSETRVRHVIDRLRRGTHLQAFVYAIAAGEGRYVALKPDFQSDENRVYSVASDDEAAQAAFESARDALLAAWDAGALFPRLVVSAGRRENPMCASCEVSAACVRGDSGARLRFGLFARREPAELGGASELERTARRVFDLHAPTPKAPKAERPEVDAPAAKAPRTKRGKKTAEDAT